MRTTNWSNETIDENGNDNPRLDAAIELADRTTPPTMTESKEDDDEANERRRDRDRDRDRDRPTSASSSSANRIISRTDVGPIIVHVRPNTNSTNSHTTIERAHLSE